MKCFAAFEVVFEIGIGRCSATGDPEALEEFHPPQPDDYLTDVVTGSQDMDIITQTILCCQQRSKANKLTIQSLAPFGPEGGCFGTFAMVTMQVTV